MQQQKDRRYTHVQPDYERSIVNLVSSLTLELGGGQQPYPALTAFGGLELAGRPIVLLIIDGLGDTFLQNHPDSFLAQHRIGRLSSVFPPTTATAVTSFFTGAAPNQHAITGWYTYFRELGTVATVLPFIPRYGGSCFTEAGISSADCIARESVFNSLAVPCHVVLPQHLADSDYSRTLSGRAIRYGYDDLEDMFLCVDVLAEKQKNALIVGYWSDLDSTAHSLGIESSGSADLFLELDNKCRTSLTRLAGRGARVIVSSDHGLIDTSEKHTIHLDDHPELAAMLTLPLCGEPRCAYCYVRSDSGEEFEGYVAEKLGQVCTLRKSGDLIRDGYFGRGNPSPRLAERVGEYTVLMKENYIIRDCLLNEKKYTHKGVHGGLSQEELYVPLIIL